MQSTPLMTSQPLQYVVTPPDLLRVYQKALLPPQVISQVVGFAVTFTGLTTNCIYKCIYRYQNEFVFKKSDIITKHTI